MSDCRNREKDTERKIVAITFRKRGNETAPSYKFRHGAISTDPPFASREGFLHITYSFELSDVQITHLRYVSQCNIHFDCLWKMISFTVVKHECFEYYQRTAAIHRITSSRTPSHDSKQEVWRNRYTGLNECQTVKITHKTVD
jgi:hypothetical protein